MARLICVKPLLRSFLMRYPHTTEALVGVANTWGHKSPTSEFPLFSQRSDRAAFVFSQTLRPSSGRQASKSLPDPDTSLPPSSVPTPQTQSEPFSFTAAQTDDVTIRASLVVADWPRSQQPYCRETVFEGFRSLPKKPGEREWRTERWKTWDRVYMGGTATCEVIVGELDTQEVERASMSLDGLVEWTKDDSFCSVFHCC